MKEKKRKEKNKKRVFALWRLPRDQARVNWVPLPAYRKYDKQNLVELQALVIDGW